MVASAGSVAPKSLSHHAAPMSTPALTLPESPATADDLDFLGCRARILTDGDRSGGRLGVVDMVEVPAGHMPPLHVHHAQDEGFYVLDGEVALLLPGREILCTPGDFVLAPRGIPH